MAFFLRNAFSEPGFASRAPCNLSDKDFRFSFAAYCNGVLNEVITLADEKVADATQALAEMKAEHDDMRSDLEHFQQHSANTTNEFMKVKAEKEALEVANAQLTAELALLQQQLAQRDAFIAERAQQWEETRKQAANLDALHRQLADLARQAAEVAPLRQRAAEADALQKLVADLKAQVVEVAPLRKLAAEAGALQKQVAEVEALRKREADLTRQVAEVAPLRQRAAEADALQKLVADLKAQVVEVAPLRKQVAQLEPLRKRLAVAESAAEGSAEKVKDLAKRLRKAEGDYGTCEADLSVWMRKHATMVEQKLEAEEQKLEAEAQRDRLFDPQLHMALVREAMPAVDVALRDLECQLQEACDLLRSADANWQEAVVWTRSRAVERMDFMYAKIQEQATQIEQLKEQLEAATTSVAV